jgi:hypothetical protein
VLKRVFYSIHYDQIDRIDRIDRLDTSLAHNPHSTIETINGQLKNISPIERSGHSSLANGMTNVVVDAYLLSTLGR